MFVPLAYNLRSLWLRKARTALTVLGIGAVVAVYIVMTAVGGQMQHLFKTTAQPDEVIVLQAGALTPEFSQASRAAATWLATQPQVAVEGGRPVVSPELALATRAVLPGGAEADLLLRGLEPANVPFYREFSLVKGAPLAAGTSVLVGVQLARARHLQLGDVLTFERTKWTVGGLFEARGGVYEQEVWVDLDALGAAANRPDVTGFLVRTRDADAAKALVDFVTGQRGEPLQALTALAAYARVGGMSLWMSALGRFIAIIIALGAIFGGMNTMYAAVAQRGRELGVLRAVGFRSGAILLSMLLESVVVGLLGGAVGMVLAFAVARVPLNMPFLLEGGVPLTGRDLGAGLVLALLVGALGGLLPALQAGSVKVVDALR
jgi:putative ABC transport system permease protein